MGKETFVMLSNLSFYIDMLKHAAGLGLMIVTIDCVHNLSKFLKKKAK